MPRIGKLLIGRTSALDTVEVMSDQKGDGNANGDSQQRCECPPDSSPFLIVQPPDENYRCDDRATYRVYNCVKNLSDIERITLLGVIVAAFVGFGQIYVYIRQAAIMDKQVSISEAQLKESQDEQRPWVYADIDLYRPDTVKNPDAKSLWFDDEGLHITLSFNLHNTGHLPATDVFIDWKPRADIQAANGYAAQREVCDQRRAAPVDSSVGRSLFPGQESAPDVIQAAIPIDELKRSSGYAFWEFSNEGGSSHMLPMVHPYIVGCIDYQIGGDRLHHETGFSFNIVGGMKIGTAEYGGIPLSKQTLPVANFSLSRDLYGKTFAAD